MLSDSSEIFCWTDSTIVLAWLKKPACSWTTFVANRVTKIAQATKIENWSHVRSEHNSADLASRGVSLQELGDSTLWWHGLQWLQLPKLQWPETSDPHPVTELEQRAVKVHFVNLPADDFLERFSRLDKVLRVLAYVQRFLNRCRKAPVSPDRQLSNREIREAEKTYIILAQREEATWLLRACGRLTASTVLQYDERHPVILPYSCRLSCLLVQFTHQITLHSCNQLIVRLVRSKYCIPKVKNLAIHLEPTADLPTEKFLAAFARFVAGRGCPQRVHSDNGKTIVGASSLLSRDFTQALKESLAIRDSCGVSYPQELLIWEACGRQE
ncbi:uncharacterized protein LOC123037137 [Drosophila rhopaloa]|uniref:Uncharacterized protein n=1 Tax=Drosophila rhopaloa TaxID=1041015 RepID=A0ABM5J164_DRORH|nr:uncharacterized protein LOC123037137 [Drosophila rhopaloa]